jgi:hypothetical protein
MRQVTYSHQQVITSCSSVSSGRVGETCSICRSHAVNHAVATVMESHLLHQACVHATWFNYNDCSYIQL